MRIASVCSTEAVTTVYNLCVADHHTYFVGGAVWGWDVWVHNARCFPKNLATAARDDFADGSFAQLKGAKGAGAATTEIHHIATNKSSFWKEKFLELFDPAGIGLDDAINKIPIHGHQGGHGLYNLLVLNRLQNAVAGLDPSTLRYKRMLQRELLIMRRELADQSSSLFGILQSAATRAEDHLARSLVR